MPKKLLLIVLCLALFQAMFGITIRQIQETSIAGEDNTYPSTLVGQDVEIFPVQIGIKGFNGEPNDVYVFDLNGGAWGGILVKNAPTSEIVSSWVKVNGTVAEVNGVTQLTNATITAFQASSHPAIAANSTTITELQDLAFAEQFESCSVVLDNISCSELPNADGEWYVSNGTESIQIDNGFDYSYTPELDQVWATITGLFTYANGEFELNPSNADDFVDFTKNNQILTTSYEHVGDNFYVHFNTNTFKKDWNCDVITINAEFTSVYLTLSSIKTDGTLAEGSSIDYDVTDSSNDDYKNLDLTITSPTTFDDAPEINIVTFVFKFNEYGQAKFDINDAVFKSNDGTDDAEYADNEVNEVIYNRQFNNKKAYLSIRNDNNNKNIFNPSYNEKVTMKYGYKTGVSCKAVVRIYDLQGRLVATPINKVISGLDELIWDGRDKHNEILEIGAYICHVEVTIRANGDKYTTDQPIVIAGKLK